MAMPFLSAVGRGLKRAVAWPDKPSIGATTDFVRSGVDPGSRLVSPVGFEGASEAPRLSPWVPSRLHINAFMSNEGPRLRARVRQLIANTPHGSNASETFAAYAVGTGITPAPRLDSADQRKAIKEAFNDWTDEADADGLTDFYGLQTLAARAMFDAGECFARLRPRRVEDGLSVPLQIQLLESEQLDQSFSEDLGNGSYIRQGIEFDAIGRRQAYHFFVRHPGDNDPRGFSLDRTRVPAAFVLHLFKPIRPGQIRGKPFLTAGMVKLHDYDEYDDAELNRKRGAAMNMGFIKTALGEPADGLPGLVDGQQADPYGNAGVVMEPSTMHVLPPGKDVTFNEPADVGPNYEAFQYRNLLALCASMGLPYHSVTGDTAKANYSSLRAALVELKRRIEQFQHETLVFQFCRPIYQGWLTAAILNGTVSLPQFARRQRVYMRCRWIPPRWDWVDPLKDVQAEALEVANGFKPRSEVIYERGEDPEDVDAQIAADHAREAELGLDFSKAPQAGDPAFRAPRGSPAETDANAPPDPQADPNAPADGGGENTGDTASQGASLEQVERLIAAMPQPVYNLHFPKTGPYRTVITKHDANGRIAELEQREAG